MVTNNLIRVLLKTERPVLGMYQMDVNCYESHCIQELPYIRMERNEDEEYKLGFDLAEVFVNRGLSKWTLWRRSLPMLMPLLIVLTSFDIF
jgi:hypothetical protein